ncbi:D-alanine--D-alanine ligase [Bartonella sp. DGB2]|uniref:D-alanine--D-alanine ligase n=1 Tax=Bartonella sp. DGB2 TaxID=3388426 RepID=UPI00398FE5D5
MALKQHVAVLMGGLSAERDVSLSTGACCAKSLEGLGYRVSCIDVGRDIASVLSALRPDVAFNALHGRFGEDGTVQAILETLEIPYTHSGILASALAMDKVRAKMMVEGRGVDVALSKIAHRSEISQAHIMRPPYVVKPIREGSSFGVIIVRDEAMTALEPLRASDWPYDDVLMVEQYIAGRELTCAVMGNEVLDVCEITPGVGYDFYDYESKYVPGASMHICPAALSPNIYQTVQRMALKAHQLLGCRGITRSDFRYDEAAGILVWLEINTQSGMTPTSLVYDMAKVKGLDYADLVRWMVEDASCMR